MLTTAESFKRFRKDFNLSKTDVAKVLGIKLPSYEYEKQKSNGKFVAPTATTLIKLAKHYNVSTDYLLGLTDDPRPYATNISIADKPDKKIYDEDLKSLATSITQTADKLTQTAETLKQILQKQQGETL